MLYSEPVPSSPHCLPSPDGTLIATLLPPTVRIYSVASLDLVRAIQLPAGLAGNVTTFTWSSSSTRVLVAVADQIHVFSALPGDDTHAVIRHPTASSAARASLVTFGPTDDEVCVWSTFGIKLTLFNLTTSKAAEVSNPKFYTPSTAARGVSFRPTTRNLALLTRTAGKDTISIHTAATRALQRSWYPDTIDAQGLEWTKDGRWLVVWESAAHGHRILCYTPDGHVFRDWHGPTPGPRDTVDLHLGAGVKSLAFSPNSQGVVVCDSSPCISLLTSSMAEEKRLRHPQHVNPKDTLQIWQESRDLPAGARAKSTFVKATQTVTPLLVRAANNSSEVKSGCNIAAFDASSNLLATRLEDVPSTIWIWDVPASELRAVLIYHSNISTVEWHPTQPELLLIRCDGENHNGIIFVWDPLSEGPRMIDFSLRLPQGAVNGKWNVTWLDSPAEIATVFFADSSTCLLAALTEADAEGVPWQDGVGHVPENMRLSTLTSADDDELADLDTDAAMIDDTFHFKNLPRHK